MDPKLRTALQRDLPIEFRRIDLNTVTFGRTIFGTQRLPRRALNQPLLLFELLQAILLEKWLAY